MWKAVVSIMAILGATSVARAQTITDPTEIASHLHFWSQEAGDPVYYGKLETWTRNESRYWVTTSAWPSHSSNMRMAYFTTLTRCGVNRQMGRVIMKT